MRLQDFGSLTTFDGSAGRNLGDALRIATLNNLYCDIVTDCALFAVSPAKDLVNPYSCVPYIPSGKSVKY